MKDQLDRFLRNLPNADTLPPAVLIDYFAYFHVVELGKESVSSNEIEECFLICRLEKYSNISSYLSRHAKRERGKKQKFIKGKAGYHLQRTFQEELKKTLRAGPAVIHTQQILSLLIPKIKEKIERDFLTEAINCYEIGAWRASIILVWILTVHHLSSYVFAKELVAFNSVLALNKDKRIKVSIIRKINDFSEIPENKLIEFMRSANIITNDVRKILDTKLGVRNSYAHPSNLSISEVKTTEYIVDLVENIIEKYEI